MVLAPQWIFEQTLGVPKQDLKMISPEASLQQQHLSLLEDTLPPSSSENSADIDELLRGSGFTSEYIGALQLKLMPFEYLPTHLAI